MEEEENINVKSRAKLQSCQKQNQLFKEEIKNTKTLIYTIIDQNNELLKRNHNFNKYWMEKKDGGYKTKNHKGKGNKGKQDVNQQTEDK